MNFWFNFVSNLSLITFACFLTSATVFGETQNFKQLANQAFAEKEYGKALQYYELAETENRSDRALPYNIGVTYYRMGQYSQAEKYLTKATKITPNNSLAFLNLGLSQVKLNKLSEAQTNFERVLQLGASEKITALAETMLERIHNEQKDKQSPENTFPLILNATMGYQDQQENPIDGKSESQNDKFLQLMAIYYHQFNNDYKNGFGFSATAFGLFYQEQQEFNLTMLALSADKTKTFGSWTGKLGLEMNEMNLGGRPFQLNSYLFTSLRYPLGKVMQWQMKLRSGYVKSLFAAYDFLEGMQHNFYSSLRFKQNSQKLTASVELERNDRKDIKDENGKLESSQSPERYRAKLKYVNSVYLPWEFGVLLEYRLSRYPGEYYPDTPPAKKREENRKRAMLGISRQLTKKLSIIFEFEYTKNDSTIDDFIYTRNQPSIGLEYLN